ncbi:MAG: bifunctional folylpolyglutamate synthase/dihydrofolate synthase [Deltaproteobacteria bacterium]|nr:bifunctional folylpolyglutamate synthase/dihydrofolate synthase [Deltaproteobacteria bacterium]
MPSADETIKYLYSLERGGIRPGLERIERLMDGLGHPHSSYPRIHVAGTNGKGSTAAFIASILQRAGYRVGLYTSPHIIKFNERIRINGRAMTDAALAKAALAVKEAAGALPEGIGPPSFFEFTTAIAFHYFREKKVDCAVIETGMGGRWDATNVIAPLVSVITTVDIDHQGHLGNSLGMIASEKAGIIKKGAPVVCGEEKAEALDVIAKKARETGVPLYRLGAEFNAAWAGPVIDYEGVSFASDPMSLIPQTYVRGRHLKPANAPSSDPARNTVFIKGLRLGLAGGHQRANAACAVAAVEVLRGLGWRISGKALKDGLLKVNWPGRVEVVAKKPLVILDCAHNPAGARALAGALQGFAFRRLILVMGIMADKDAGGIIEALAPLAHAIIFAAPVTDRAKSAEKLAADALPYAKTVITAPTVTDACKTAIAGAGPDDAVCVTGSIFTVGEARGWFLKKRRKG